MAKENMKSSLIFTTLLLIGVFFGDINCNLAKRITTLESKVFYDSLEFRENIESILEKLNMFNVSIKNDANDANDETCHAKEILFEKDLKTIKRAVQSVKHHMNKEWQDFKAEIDQRVFLQSELNNLKIDMKGHDLQLKTFEDKMSLFETITTQGVFLQTDLKNLKSEIEEQHVRLNSVEDRFSSFKTEMNQKLLLQTDLMNNLISEIKGQNLRLKTVEDKLSSPRSTGNKLISEINSQSLCSEKNGHRFGSSCYYIPDDSKPWEDALSECKSKGAHLVSVESEAENEFLINLASRLTNTKTDFGVWLGASDLEVEGTWLWEWNKKNIDAMYNNFKANEPNGQIYENCLHLYRQSSWKWNDTPCKNIMGYICEI